MCDSVPSDLIPYVYSFLLSNNFPKAAKALKKESKAAIQTQKGPGLIDFYQFYRNSHSGKHTSSRRRELQHEDTPPAKRRKIQATPKKGMTNGHTEAKKVTKKSASHSNSDSSSDSVEVESDDGMDITEHGNKALLTSTKNKKAQTKEKQLAPPDSSSTSSSSSSDSENEPSKEVHKKAVISVTEDHTAAAAASPSSSKHKKETRKTAKKVKSGSTTNECQEPIEAAVKVKSSKMDDQHKESQCFSDDVERSKPTSSQLNTPQGEVEDATTPAVSQKAKKKSKHSNTPFRRISEDVAVDSKVADNSFQAKAGARGSWGEKAHKDLQFTKGKSFRHEKTKKKRGSYRGGAIDTTVCSVKFDSD